ncbi:hypothetical protein PM8797T_20598 [Gimesia maris DSM 8797]|uniref:Exo-alpha-sialidase n=2 Tax=Gimesia maris TaxID=122 RepID=A0ABX5YSY6_9PLAN|nr:hypothetical protein PM8797T_20598 [Gimesia maris DSM 8797]QEG18697.1 hypothetical protein GmarT_45870 [Gimesia maris]
MTKLTRLNPVNGNTMMRHTLILTALLLLLINSAVHADPKPERPVFRQEQVILNPDQFSAEKQMSYLAFPAVLRLNSKEILISYKRGRRHSSDPGAVLEMVRFDTGTNEITERRVIGEQQPLIFQMGEWVQFPQGRIGNLVDVQKVVQARKRNHRTGVYWTMSDDQGKTFSPMQKLGPIDGVEYGYIFESAVVGDTVYLLAMDFPELTARKSAYDEQGKRIYGQVSVIASADNGQSWKHVRNLSREFGDLNLNESSIIVDGTGFLIATRGYDNRVRLHRVDQDFKLIKQRDLTAACETIGTHIGRPRLFKRNGHLYLLGRNSRGGPMELALFRINPDSFDVERHVVLDPEPGVTIKDGYYAVPYFQQNNDQTLFNVVTYRMSAGNQKNPELVRLEFLWNEIR